MSWTKDDHNDWQLMVANAVKMGKTVVSVSPTRLADALEEIVRLSEERRRQLTTWILEGGDEVTRLRAELERLRKDLKIWEEFDDD